MKTLIRITALTALAVLVYVPVLAQSGGGSNAFPTDPEQDAIMARVRVMIEEARQLAIANRDQEAITRLNQAATLESTMRHPTATAKLKLASVYVKLNNIPEALDAYRQTFVWNPSRRYGGDWRGDLYPRPGSIHSALHYAVLLANEGRAADAKAMYYFCLRSYMLEAKSRSTEPAPFLVVFDPDPEGIYWEYSPQRLEAAASMLQAMLSSGSTDFATNLRTDSQDYLQRARTLAPHWFYPILYRAFHASNGSEREQQLLAEAEALAKPGLEKQLVQGVRDRLADWKVYCEQNNIAWGLSTDDRPLTEGADRRKRMQCLRPNEQVLKRLSIERPQ